MNTGSLNMSRAGEYAIAALTRLALASLDEPGKLVPVRILAESQDLPKSFLSKILELCLKKGLIVSRSGARGGVGLARPAAEVSLLDILEACEGAYHRTDCVFYSDRTCDGPECVVFCPLRKREEDVRLSLARTTLAEMARSLMVHPLNTDVSPGSEQGAGRTGASGISQGGR